MAAVEVATASKDALTLEDIIRKAYICIAPIVTESFVQSSVTHILLALVESLIFISDIQYERPTVQKLASTIILQAIRLFECTRNVDRLQRVISTTHQVYKRIKKRFVLAKKRDPQSTISVELELEQVVLYIFTSDTCSELAQFIENDSEGCYDDVLFKVYLQANNDALKSVEVLQKMKDNAWYARAVMFVSKKLMMKRYVARFIHN